MLADLLLRKSLFKARFEEGRIKLRSGDSVFLRLGQSVIGHEMVAKALKSTAKLCWTRARYRTALAKLVRAGLIATKRTGLSTEHGTLVTVLRLADQKPISGNDGSPNDQGSSQRTSRRTGQRSAARATTVPTEETTTKENDYKENAPPENAPEENGLQENDNSDIGPASGAEADPCSLLFPFWRRSTGDTKPFSRRVSKKIELLQNTYTIWEMIFAVQTYGEHLGVVEDVALGDHMPVADFFTPKVLNRYLNYSDEATVEKSTDKDEDPDLDVPNVHELLRRMRARSGYENAAMPAAEVLAPGVPADGTYLEELPPEEAVPDVEDGSAVEDDPDYRLISNEFRKQTKLKILFTTKLKEEIDLLLVCYPAWVIAKAFRVFARTRGCRVSNSSRISSRSRVPGVERL